VVLHFDDQSLMEAQAMGPLVPRAVAVGPGEDDRNAAVLLLDPVDAQVVVTRLLAPLDR
jgi:hypothetical protein